MITCSHDWWWSVTGYVFLICGARRGVPFTADELAKVARFGIFVDDAPEI
jgi:hypothetical protein